MPACQLTITCHGASRKKGGGRTKFYPGSLLDCHRDRARRLGRGFAHCGAEIPRRCRSVGLNDDRGDGNILNGKLFPAGTLKPGDQKNDPNDPGSIGDSVDRGTSTATLVEHIANPDKYGVFSTSYFLLYDGRGLVSDGWYKPSRAIQYAITGGMGAFRGASGEWSGVDIGTNSTGCPNTRITISLEKQAPK